MSQLIAHAGKLGVSIKAEPTQWPGHAVQLAAEAARAGVPMVIAYGGDGTVNEVLQGLAGTSTVLAVWPGGTANVLARELGMPRDPIKMAARLAAGATRQVALGKANERYFILMAGVGLDATVTAGVKRNLKRYLGEGAFALAALDYLWRWQLERVTVHWNDGHPPSSGAFVVVGNTRGYGGGFLVTPHVALEEPMLEVCVFAWETRPQLLRYVLPVRRGAHAGLPGVTSRKVTGLVIKGDAPVQLDGELCEELPLHIKAVADALTLLV